MSSKIHTQNCRMRRKAKGLCYECGNPLDREGVRCSKCNERINQQSKKRRSWYASNGICPGCGKNDLFGDEKRCIECRAHDSGYQRITYEKNKEKRREKCRRTYYKRKEKFTSAAGLCNRCGRKNADSRYKTCPRCRAMARERYEKNNTRSSMQDRKERYLDGICFYCNNPIKEGYKVCEEHYQMVLIRNRSEQMAAVRKELKAKKLFY